MEIAFIAIGGILLGSLLQKLAGSLYERWTTDYVKQEEFDEFKSKVNQTFLKKEDYDNDLNKLLKDIEEVKKLIVVIAIKLNVDVASTDLSNPMENIREVLTNGKDKNKN